MYAKSGVPETFIPKARREVLTFFIPQRLGREINPVVMTPDEFASRRRKKDHFRSTVHSAPRLTVAGTDDDLTDWERNGWLTRHTSSPQEDRGACLIEGDLGGEGSQYKGL